MDTPQNITELRRFLEMVNQLGKFLPNQATETDSTGSSWYWAQPQRHAFNEIKRVLSSSPVSNHSMTQIYLLKLQLTIHLTGLVLFSLNSNQTEDGVKCRRRAVQSFWLPGLSRNIKELIDNCRVSSQATNHPEQLIPTLMPERPWQKVAADLLEFKKAQYLVVLDYYSPYIELSKLESTTSAAVINHMKSILARHGVPETLVSDNDSQFASKEFSAFAN